MLCPWRASAPGLLLLFTVFLVAANNKNSFNFTDSANSRMAGQQMTQNNSSILTEVSTVKSVLMGTNLELCCHPGLLPGVLLITWKISHKGQLLCIKAYKTETNQTTDTNCTDGRITWATRPDLSPHLQIHAVAVTHDGNYTCEAVKSTGNFQHMYQLQVLVAPEAHMFLTENRSLVCEALAGKPAAQISWTPQGRCVTKEEDNSNGTVTVRSTCSYTDSNASSVTCLVSHLTGNRSLSEVLPSGTLMSEDLHTLYIVPPVIIIIILIIVGSVSFLKIRGFRKCKLKKPTATPVVEENEMEPYACYTEKNNPLYETTNKVKMFHVS